MGASALLAVPVAEAQASGARSAASRAIAQLAEVIWLEMASEGSSPPWADLLGRLHEAADGHEDASPDGEDFIALAFSQLGTVLELSGSEDGQVFDWANLQLQRWTPLSALGKKATLVTGGLYAVGPCVFALTNASFGSAPDPGIGGFLWARSPAIAEHLYERRGGFDATAGGPCPSIPRAVIGFEPLTFGAVMADARRRGEDARVSATYSFPDGELVSSEVRCRGRDVIFASANPRDDELAVAVRFDLPRSPDEVGGP